MSDGTWHMGGTWGGAQERRRTKGSSLARTTAMRELGAVVYAARLADGTIKIGWTERFDLRLHWLKHYAKQDVELLAFKLAGIEVEQEIHARLEPYRAQIPEHPNAREFYRPVPQVLAVINELRDELGLPAVAA